MISVVQLSDKFLFMKDDLSDQKYKIIKSFKNIYHPAEDTYLLEGVLPKYDPSCWIVELGCGSGYLLSRLDAFVKLGIDVNEEACRCSRLVAETCILNADLLRGLRVLPDIIVFNPPYVPGSSSEISSDYDLAWNGLNYHGDAVIDEFFNQVASKVTKPLTLYMVRERVNRYDEIIGAISQDYPHLEITVTTLVERRIVNEYLSVKKITIDLSRDSKSKCN